MDIATVLAQLAVLLPLLLLGEVLLAVALRGRGGFGGRFVGQGRLVLTWFGLTVLTVWVAFMFAFVAIHALLFIWGTVAAWIGVLAFVAVTAATPFAWARVLRQSRHFSPRG